MSDVFINFNGDIIVEDKLIDNYNDIKPVHKMETKLIIYKRCGKLIFHII